MKRRYKFSKRYLRKCEEVADEMNVDFRYEGLRDRAFVRLGKNGYEIAILRYGGENTLWEIKRL